MRSPAQSAAFGRLRLVKAITVPLLALLVAAGCTAGNGAEPTDVEMTEKTEKTASQDVAALAAHYEFPSDFRFAELWWRRHADHIVTVEDDRWTPPILDAGFVIEIVVRLEPGDTYRDHVEVYPQGLGDFTADFPAWYPEPLSGMTQADVQIGKNEDLLGEASGVVAHPDYLVITLPEDLSQ